MSVSMQEFRNKTRETLYLLLGDKKLEVGPLDSTLLDDAEAELALLKYSDVLERVNTEGLGSELKEYDPDAPIWLANMSGNPDAPEEVELSSRKNKFTGMHERRFTLNMLAKPRDYTIWRRPAPERKNIDGFTVDVKQAKRAYTLRYKECRPIEPRLAKAFLASTAGLPKEAQGWVIQSRPQDFFKPDKSWSYDEIVLWLDLVKKDFRADQFPTEAKIRREARNKSHAERNLYEAKEEMLKRAFFVCADPQYKVPTRSEWEKYYGTADVAEILGEDEEVSEAAEKVVAAKTAKKKPGRPRANASA